MAVCSRLHHNMCSDAVKFWRGRMEDWKSWGIIMQEEDARKNNNVNKKRLERSTQRRH
jgi:hypothetical protein